MEVLASTSSIKSTLKKVLYIKKNEIQLKKIIKILVIKDNAKIEIRLNNILNDSFFNAIYKRMKQNQFQNCILLHIKTFYNMNPIKNACKF